VFSPIFSGRYPHVQMCTLTWSDGLQQSTWRERFQESSDRRSATVDSVIPAAGGLWAFPGPYGGDIIILLLFFLTSYMLLFPDPPSPHRDLRIPSPLAPQDVQTRSAPASQLRANDVYVHVHVRVCVCICI